MKNLCLEPKAQVMSHAAGDDNSMNFQFVLHMQPLYPSEKWAEG